MDADKNIEKAATQEGAELTDEQLDKVAGGWVDANGVYTCEICGYVGDPEYAGSHHWICPVCKI